MPETVLQIDARDNVVVALAALDAGAAATLAVRSSAPWRRPFPPSTKWRWWISSPATWFFITEWWWAKRWKRYRAEAC